jgi:DNA-damage-inducible protein D
MSQIDILANDSTFDKIRHEDERGEHWSARELMPVMGYGADWRNFAEAVSRAAAACRNAGYDPADHIGDANKMVRIGSGAQRSVPDFRLTRFGAYLVAMNGDPRKSEIAAAQTYFAVKTRQAEVAPAAPALPDMTTPAGRVQVAEMLLAGAKREVELTAAVADRDARLAIAAPKAEYVDGFVNPDDDMSLIRVFAAQLGVGEKALRAWLVDRKVVYRRTVGQRWSNTQGRLVPEYEWLAYAGYQSWFKPVDQPNAPRLHNGQTATTLYVTPPGKVAIRRLLMKHPLVDGEAA